MQQTLEGGYIIAGTSSSGGNWEDALLMKIDASGNTTWEKTFGGSYRDWASSVQQTADGGYILVGTTNPGGPEAKWSAWLVKTDADGNVVFDSVYERTGQSWGEGVRQTQDGGYIVVGYATSVDPPYYSPESMWLAKTDAFGKRVWEKTYKDPGQKASSGHRVELTQDGGYYVLGEKWSSSNCLYPWLVKTDASGNGGGRDCIRS